MRQLVGTWECSYRGDDGTSSSTERDLILNDYWLELHINHGAMAGRFPAHQHEAWMSYDNTKKRWIEIHIGSRGSYGADVSYAPATSKQQRWVTEYPPPKAGDGYTIVDYQADRIVRHEYWEESGKPQTAVETCTRSSPH